MTGSKTKWKRDPDRWRIRVDVGRDHNGKRIQLSAVIEAPWTKEGEREVDVALAKLAIDAALRRADPEALTQVTVSELIDRFLDHRETRVRYGTLTFYRRHLEVARTHIGGMPVRAVRPETLDELYRVLAKETKTVNKVTVRAHSDLKIVKVHRSLKALFNRALRVWQIIDANPAWGAEPPSLGQVDVTIPEVAQLEESLGLLRDLDDGGHRMMWAFASLTRWTGARRQVVTGLTRDRVRLPDAADGIGALDMSKAIAQGSGGRWVYGPTKTGKEHAIALGPRSVSMLRNHMAWLDECAVVMRGDTGPWLFPLDPSTPDVLPRPDAWTKRWADVRDRIGLPGVKLHHLRHYSAAHLFAGGFDSITIAGRHSHSTPSVTEKTYAKFLPPRDIAAALYLEQLGQPAATED